MSIRTKKPFNPSLVKDMYYEEGSGSMSPVRQAKIVRVNDNFLEVVYDSDKEEYFGETLSPSRYYGVVQEIHVDESEPLRGGDTFNENSPQRVLMEYKTSDMDEPEEMYMLHVSNDSASGDYRPVMVNGVGAEYLSEVASACLSYGGYIDGVDMYESDAYIPLGDTTEGTVEVVEPVHLTYSDDYVDEFYWIRDYYDMNQFLNRTHGGSKPVKLELGNGSHEIRNTRTTATLSTITSVDLGDTVDTLGARWSIGLSQPTGDAIDLSNITTVGPSAFVSTNIKYLNLPNAITAGESAFASSSIYSLTAPKLETVGVNAFSNIHCASISLPSLTSLARNAFNSTNNVNMVTLKVCKSLEDQAFMYCQGLNYLHLGSNTMVTLGGSNVFAGTTFGRYGKVYVPENLIPQYQADSRWSAVGCQFLAETNQDNLE